MIRIAIFIFLIHCVFGCEKYTQSIKVITEQPIIPVLTNKAENPLLKLIVIKNDSSDNVLGVVNASLEGTTCLEDIESVSLHKASTKGYINTKECLGVVENPSQNIEFVMNYPLVMDTTIFWLSVDVKDKVNLLNKVNASLVAVTTNQGKVRESNFTQHKGLRLGVAVRQHKQDNIHTSRIPGLVTTNTGTLIAVFDARRESSRDVQGDVDVCIHRSYDGGVTWEPIQVIMDRGEWGGLPQKFNGIGDANVLVDTETGNIFVSAFWVYGLRDNKTGQFIENLTEDSKLWSHCWFGKGSQPGLSERETGQFLITKSTDDGDTWSSPINLTKKLKDPKWWLFIPAPGSGITMSDGTLIIPTQGRDHNGLAFSNFIYSKDRGENWAVVNQAFDNTTECNIVELNNGALMLNMRDNRNADKGVNENPLGESPKEKARAVAVTKDMGKTWEMHPTHRKALLEPLCMGCLYKYPYQVEHQQNKMLLFSNPNAMHQRKNITIKASFDDGASWPEKHWILLDEDQGFGYSSMAAVNDSIVGILYESSRANLVFQQISVSDILANSK